MTKVRRFDWNYVVDSSGNIDEVFMEETPGGPYVAYEDYDALQARLDSAEKALKGLMNAETLSVHVGYDEGAGGGNYVYADAVRTDDDAFLAARAHLSQYGERT